MTEEKSYLDSVLTGETIGERLRNARDEWGETQASVEKATGVKRSTLANYEAGKSIPRAEQLTALADFYGVSPGWILYGKSASSSVEENTMTNRLAQAAKGLTDDEISILIDIAGVLKKHRNNDN